MMCWGYNIGSQVGDNTTTNRTVPTAIVGGGAWSGVALGGSYSCGLGVGGTPNIWCWGTNQAGEQGRGEFGETASPDPLPLNCQLPYAKAGVILYNSTTHDLQYCDGAGWVAPGAP